MKYFFINSKRNTGYRLRDDNSLGYITNEKDLKECLNKGTMKNYLKIPSFDKGDKIKLIENDDMNFLHGEDLGKEFTFVEMQESGRLTLKEKHASLTIFIIDIEPI